MRKFYPHEHKFESVEEDEFRGVLMRLGYLVRGPQTFYEGDGGWYTYCDLVDLDYATFTHDQQDRRRVFTISANGRDLYRAELLKDLDAQRRDLERRLEAHKAFTQQIASGEAF